jgi:hypothetical protein
MSDLVLPVVLPIVAQSEKKKKTAGEKFIKSSAFWAQGQEKSKKGLQNGAVSYKI